jgi:hypothetical protein
MAHKRLEQPVVLYIPAKLNPEKGFKCGNCIMGLEDTSECSILEPANVDLEYGVCGFHVPGENTTSKKHPPMEIIPKDVAGYIEDGPTYCGVCEYFIPPNSCEVVNGKIDEYGCCNHWEGK